MTWRLAIGEMPLRPGSIAIFGIYDVELAEKAAAMGAAESPEAFAIRDTMLPFIHLHGVELGVEVTADHITARTERKSADEVRAMNQAEGTSHHEADSILVYLDGPMLAWEGDPAGYEKATHFLVS